MPDESSEPDPKLDLMLVCAKRMCHLCTMGRELDLKTMMHRVGPNTGVACQASGIHHLIAEYKESGRIIVEAPTNPS